MAELDDQLALLLEALDDATPAELEWQSAPGMNTIGMLLAHLAIVEVFWVQVGLLGESEDVARVIGLDMNGDGIPIAAGATPPANLARMRLSAYRDLLVHARSYLTDTVRDRDDAWLGQERTRTRRNGNTEQFDHRWVLYHLLEHFAAHSGQILMIRHAFRNAQTALAEPA
jgi:uncharacterized damage-inducible protein DinB